MVRFKNRSMLRALDGVLMATMVVVGVVAVLMLIEAVTSKTLADLTVVLPRGPADGSLPQGVVLEQAEGLVTARLGLGYRLAWWLVGPASSVLVIAGVAILRDIVSTARAGDPFIIANVRRVRSLALLTMGYFVFDLARSIVAVSIQDELGISGATTSLSFVPLVSGLVLLAFAEIWQRGVDLRDEHQLTV